MLIFAKLCDCNIHISSIIAYVPEGYEFIRWESSSANALIADINSVNTILIMPDEDLIVTAIMRE